MTYQRLSWLSAESLVMVTITWLVTHLVFGVSAEKVTTALVPALAFAFAPALRTSKTLKFWKGLIIIGGAQIGIGFTIHFLFRENIGTGLIVAAGTIVLLLLLGQFFQKRVAINQNIVSVPT